MTHITLTNFQNLFEFFSSGVRRQHAREIWLRGWQCISLFLPLLFPPTLFHISRQHSSKGFQFAPPFVAATPAPAAIGTGSDARSIIRPARAAVFVPIDPQKECYISRRRTTRCPSLACFSHSLSLSLSFSLVLLNNSYNHGVLETEANETNFKKKSFPLLKPEVSWTSIENMAEATTMTTIDSTGQHRRPLNIRLLSEAISSLILLPVRMTRNLN